MAKELDISRGALIARLGREYRTGRLKPRNPCQTPLELRSRKPDRKKLSQTATKPKRSRPTRKPLPTASSKPEVVLAKPSKPPTIRRVNLDDPRYTPPPLTPWVPPARATFTSAPVIPPARSCQFPLWSNDQRPDKHAPMFCDAPSVSGVSYCRKHLKVVYNRMPHSVAEVVAAEAA